ncbi:GH25 family lysozyme [Clostridium butyricum]|uniref:GH25 family lysozyme n=1 Tax=Clostridium butyricum TaxID=1492 RepID=UPI00374FB50D
MALNIQGVDISNNNPISNLSTLTENGVQYLYLKSTEGATFVDQTTPARYVQAKNLGLKVGFYHFLVGTSLPEAQAENAYNATKTYAQDLAFMLDVEVNFDSLCDYVLRFINRWQELSNVEIGIYTYSGFISNLTSISNYIESRKLWIANYTSSYNNVNTGFFYNIVGWQYTENGTIGSFTGDCDYFSQNCLVQSKQGEWQLNNVGWWYKFNDGTYPANEWYKIDGKWYLFNSEGYTLYGWQWSDGGNWYYLGGRNDGSMKTGWVLTGGKWYYFNSQGAMQVGWQEINNQWYYFDSNGEMQTGWLKYNGEYYLLYSDGQMARNCELYGYSFNNSGVATKTQ